MKELASPGTAQLRSPPCSAESWRMIKFDRRRRAFSGSHTMRPQIECEKCDTVGNWRDLGSARVTTRYRPTIVRNENKCVKQITMIMWTRY